MDEMHTKYQELLAYLHNLGSVAVAFSGGVDSAFLLCAAKEALGDQVLAVTLASCLLPERELQEAGEFCALHQIRHVVLGERPLEIEGFAQNPPDRCYLCKRKLYEDLIQTAQDYDMAAVIEGSNVDDQSDYRPGMMAISELGVKSPLRIAGLTKEEIRQLWEEFGLTTYDKPSYACLASRFGYGQRITEEKLQMVDAAEQCIMDLGIRQVRVRIHGKEARIEVLPEDFDTIMAPTVREGIYNDFKELGFSHVGLDLRGYRSGNMYVAESKQLWN